MRGRQSWTGLSDELWQGFEGGALVPLLARARHFRAWLHEGGVQSHLRGDIDLRLYYANNHPTPHRFGFDAGKPVLLDETVDGDSLVPFQRTLMALNRAGLREFTRELGGDTVMEHLSLFNDGRVAAVVTSFLEAGA